MQGHAAENSLQHKDRVQPPRRRSAKPAATLPELRFKAAFRACDRLMEHGASSDAQLWSIARVMCADEFEQAAEERSLAGKCGWALCSQPPCSRQQDARGGRHRISTVQQAGYALSSAGDEPMYCSAECEAAVKRFSMRLGNGALALERFSAMYQLLQRQDKQRQQQPEVVASDAEKVEAAAHASNKTALQPAQQNAGEVSVAAAAASATTTPAVGPSSDRDSGPGGIRSSTTLMPRLAVEQVEVKHIDSSAGQFGDFSRKPKPRIAHADGTTASQPKGVLKKQSKFAAGSAKVPILLAEVKERDPNMVAADTARGLQPSRTSNSKAAVAVEGYVPRAHSARRQQQRRVRFTDDVEAGEAAKEEQALGTQGRQAVHIEPSTSAAAVEDSAACSVSMVTAPPNVGSKRGSSHAIDQNSVGAGIRGAGSAASSSTACTAAYPAGPNPDSRSTTAPSNSVLVFEVEDPNGQLCGGDMGLAANFGRLYVADAAQEVPAPLPLATDRTATPSSPSPSHDTSSGCIDIQQHGTSGGIGGSSSSATPREWREVPQFYAHSPVGSSSNLASPGASNGNLATVATSSPPQSHLSQRLSCSPPPGLPRARSNRPCSPSAPQKQLQPQQVHQKQLQLHQVHADIAHGQAPNQDAMEGSSSSTRINNMDRVQGKQLSEQQGGTTAAQQFGLPRRQAEQLQRVFPPLSATFPPELQAVLASDTETESEEAESEDWMRSDDDIDEAGSSSGDEAMLRGTRSGFRIQLSFFGTLFTHLEAWVTSDTVELLASEPDADVALPPLTSPDVLAALSRCLAAALPPVLTGLQVAAARGEVERSLDELLRTFRLVGPLPAFKVSQWQVVLVLFLKALSLERCPPLREAFETRDGIGRLNRLLASLSFTSEEFWAVLELLCPAE